jgi:amino-acid N-acetyltransferase
MVKDNRGTKLQYQIRKARIQDAKAMQKLINAFAQEGSMLSRALSEMYDNIRDFHVCEADGEIVGASALHVVWEDLAEIKSLAVTPDMQGQGIGTQLARAGLAEAASLQVRQVFTLTDKQGFFEKIGFHLVDKSVLPQKVWGECIKCFKFPECNEVAMIYDLEKTPVEPC